MLKRIILLFVAFFLRAIVAATVEGEIKIPDEIFSSKDLAETKIELIEITNVTKLPFKKTAYVQKNGHFKLSNVQEGSYLLSVSSIIYNLQPFKTRVDVDAEDNIAVHLFQAGNKFDELKIQVPHPIKVISNGKLPKRNYVTKRAVGILESGPIATIINNPLYLGGAIVGIVAVLAPLLLEKFDPETAKLVKEQRAENRSRSTQAALGAVEKIQSTGDTVINKIGEKRASKIDSSSKKRKN